MGNLSYLVAAIAVVWVGIFAYMWTLRRSVERLQLELEALRTGE